MKVLLALSILAFSSLSFAQQNNSCGDGTYGGAKYCLTNGDCMDHCGAMSSEFNPIHAALVPSADGGRECGCVTGLMGGGDTEIRERAERFEYSR